MVKQRKDSLTQKRQLERTKLLPKITFKLFLSMVKEKNSMQKSFFKSRRKDKLFSLFPFQKFPSCQSIF